MENKKVSQQINDIVGDNIQKLAAIFPSVVKDGEVDFAALREELGQFNEVSAEKYELTWAGKRAAKMVAQEDVLGRTLKYCAEESVAPETTKNLYIEGDNLEVLKLLRQNYYAAVKMIYIDPPYNTGNDFVYNDSFHMDALESEVLEGNISELNVRFTQNVATSNRYHANWINMMYPRLRIAKDLLSEDGVIFISIDDHECVNLINICNEIFGENCYVGDISWQRTYAPRNDSKGISNEVEHIIVFSKSSGWQPKKLPRTAEMNAKYKSIDGDPVLWRADNPCGPGANNHQGMVYAIQHPFTGQMIYPTSGAHWRYQQDEMFRIMSGWGKYKLENLNDEKQRAVICGVTEDSVKKDVLAIVLEEPIEIARKTAKEVYDKGNWPIYYFTSGGTGGIAKKTYLDESNGKVVTNFWPHSETGHTDEAKKELQNLFDGNAPFDTPKPTRLIDRILSIATDKDSLVMDFFSGSATLADAVMKKNSNDGGNRQYILVQIPETSQLQLFDNLCEIGKERIRRAGKKIQKTDTAIDIGFKVFKTADTNIKWNSLINNGQLDLRQIESTPDMMDFMPGSKDEDIVYELILRQRDVPLSEKMEKLVDIGKRTYLYADSYLVCLENKVTETMVMQMASLDPIPVKYIFRDSAFGDDISLKDETFRRLKAMIDKKSGDVKVSYTVEFI